MNDKSNRDSYHCSNKINQYINELKEIDLELAYLALLTYEGLKPLSRWEKPLDREEIILLEQTSLLTKQIPRTVKTGSQIIETIFSRSKALLRMYEQHFENNPIDKSPETQRIEGYLFGYPPCCIEQYINRPYGPNSLKPEDQKTLFHWACKDCKVTPTLLHNYKILYDYLINNQ